MDEKEYEATNMAAQEKLEKAVEYLNSDRPTSNPDKLLQFFAYDHLPIKLQEVSIPFSNMAKRICELLPQNPERTVALRKLLEAKDCAVRSLIYKD